LGGPIAAGWILLLVGVAIAFVPVGGFIVWLLGVPLCFAAFALGILGAAKGKTLAGVLLILASMTAGPVAFAIVPMVSLQAKFQRDQLERNEKLHHR